MLIFLLYMAAGVFVGLASGLFGIGGGMIAVPALLPIFAAQGLDTDVAMHLAIGSSIGGYLGAKLTMNRGEQLIRKVLTITILLMIVKLLFFN